MSDQTADGDTANLNEQARRVRNAIAQWWDDQIGDGNQFQDELIEPTTQKLIGDLAGKTVLDVACGAGRFARRMALLGARVVAVDFCEAFLARAKKRTDPAAAIEYRLCDATDPNSLRSLGAARFDGTVATMALMDMADIEPLLAALPTLLKPGGWFVFSVIHPCFQTPNHVKFVEATESPGVEQALRGVKVTRYLQPRPWRGEGILGQPEPLLYFHRPLNVLLGAGLRNGLVVDGLEEPPFQTQQQDNKALRWDSMPEIPPVLVVRMRLPASPSSLR
jgi:2-polyprenyl-3-methyl-5-hydroxy-6-metoxy-1,4-benzoquinol methylase